MIIQNFYLYYLRRFYHTEFKEKSEKNRLELHFSEEVYKRKNTVNQNAFY